MNKNFYAPVSIFVALVVTACAQNFKLMNAKSVSQTQTHLPSGQSLKASGPVAGEHCSTRNTDKDQGDPMALSVQDAQKKYNVDFISNVSFHKTKSCVIVRGIGQKIVK